MICPKCRNEVPDESIFCNICGSKISNNISVSIKINYRQEKKVKINKNILQEELNEIIWYYSKKVI